MVRVLPNNVSSGRHSQYNKLIRVPNCFSFFQAKVHCHDGKNKSMKILPSKKLFDIYLEAAVSVQKTAHGFVRFKAL